MLAQKLFDECGGQDLDDPIEQLRFFVSCMEKVNSEDWLDIEKYFDNVIIERESLRKQINDKSK